MAHDKQTAQYYVALMAVLILGVLTAVSLVGDLIHGGTGQVTMLLIGGLIAVVSAAATWLFRTNGHGAEEAAPAAPPGRPVSPARVEVVPGPPPETKNGPGAGDSRPAAG